jgi:peptidoglycan pentaglycine glycine transferase (the first glycine)
VSLSTPRPESDAVPPSSGAPADAGERIDARLVGIRLIDASTWEPAAWDELAVRSEMGEAFQSHAWGELKRGLGWTPLRYVVESGGRRVAVAYVQERSLLRRLPGPLGRLRLHYAPRGPILLEATPEAALAALAGIGRLARARRAVTVTVDPAWDEGGELAAALEPAGYRPAAREIQVSRTAMVVPLLRDEAAQKALLGHTTGYDIGKARKAGVTVERVDMADPAVREPGLRDFFEMYEATGRREGFLVRDRDYELEQWRRLGEAGLASLWLAGVDGARETGAVLLRSGTRLVYYVAGSRDDADLHRTRANHLLQWQIIRWAAEAGFNAYDMGGVDSHTAPGLPQDESHPLWNLLMFKRRFGASGSVIARAHEYAPHASLGALWRLARRFR